MTVPTANYDVGAAVRQHPAPWPHLYERCDMTKATCSIDGCANPSRKLTWCEKHYARYKRHGDPTVMKRMPSGMTCLVDGCDKRAVGRGHCMTHYTRLLVHGDADTLLRVPNGEPLAWLQSALAERDRAECWDWPYSVNDMGYGKLYHKGRLWYAHRLARALDGRPVPDGLFARHRCDRPICCNPDHMDVGTQKDNLGDMVRRGRALTGERNPQAKLTEEQVVEIRHLCASGLLQREVAALFGITQTTVSGIVQGKKWKHVGGAR